MDEKQYTVAGKAFMLHDLKIGQTRWIMQVVKGYSVFSLSPQKLLELFSEHLTTLLAIVLVEQGKTQQEKIRAGWDGIRTLAAWFDENMDPDVCAEVLRDFLESGRLQKAMTLIDVNKLMTPTTSPGLTVSSAP